MVLGCEPSAKQVLSQLSTIFNFVLNYLSEHGDGDQNILDVGCGFGDYLKMAADRGWMVNGVEITGDAARKSRELVGEKNIFHGFLLEAGYPGNFFMQLLYGMNWPMSKIHLKILKNVIES